MPPRTTKIHSPITPVNPDEAEIQRQFLHALHLGTGQAMLLMRAHPELDFSAPLIYAACHQLANDPQSEGSRAVYLFALIKRSRQRAMIVAKVLQTLKTKKHDYWALDQLCDLALLFWRAGIPGAREAFLARFEKNLFDGFEFCGTEQILRMEGVPGLLRLATINGRLLAEDRDETERWHVDEFQQKNKAIDVYAVLEQAAQGDADIRRYLDALNKEDPIVFGRRSRRKPRVIPLSYEAVQERIHRPGRNVGFNAERAMAMDAAVAEQLARDFLAEPDPLKQAKYLKLFGVRPYPLDLAPLFKLARKKISGKSRLVPNAIAALGHFASDEIRRFALEKLASEHKPDEYILLLRCNLQQEDMPLLLRVIERSDDFDYIHGLIADLLKVFHANPHIDCSAPLLAMYARMNCGLHREDLLTLLHERHALPPSILPELQFDSYDEVRALYRKIEREQRRPD